MRVKGSSKFGVEHVTTRSGAHRHGVAARPGLHRHQSDLIDIRGEDRAALPPQAVRLGGLTLKAKKKKGKK